MASTIMLKSTGLAIIKQIHNNYYYTCIIGSLFLFYSLTTHVVVTVLIYVILLFIRPTPSHVIKFVSSLPVHSDFKFLS